MAITQKVTAWIRKLTGRTAPETKSGAKGKVPLGMKRCPQCDRTLLRSALRCIHCGHFFEPKVQ